MRKTTSRYANIYNKVKCHDIHFHEGNRGKTNLKKMNGRAQSKRRDQVNASHRLQYKSTD